MIPVDRFFSFVVFAEDGCWLWTRNLNSRGYGRFYFEGKNWLAHRLAYTWWRGELTEGLVLDHYVCDTKRCVNPDHLRETTNQENIARSRVPRTTCSKGHDLTIPGAKYSGGKCRLCRIAASHAYYHDIVKTPSPEGALIL